VCEREREREREIEREIDIENVNGWENKKDINIYKVCKSCIILPQ